MRSKLLYKLDNRKTFLLVFDTGDEVIEGILSFAKENNLSAGYISAIGAVSSAQLGFFNWETKSYDDIPVDEQTEVVSLTGNLAIFDGAPRVHAHALLSKQDGTCIGGHVIKAIVRPTLELMLTEFPVVLERKIDEESSLALIV